MKFGIFDHLERRHDCNLPQQYEERLQLMAQADEAGVYSYHFAEHHHSPLCQAPNQSVFLAAAAQRTKKLKIGTLVYVLPMYQPVRLIEEICMVDCLSNGRVQVGVGRGAAGGYEIGIWGTSHDPNELFDETLEILLKGLRNDFLDHEGKYYQLKHLWMELRSVQKPHPAFWYAGNPDHAGELGMNFIGAGTIGKTKELSARYLKAFKKGQANPGPGTVITQDPLYGSMRRLFIADTDAEAKERAYAAYELYRTHFAKPLPPNVVWEKGKGYEIAPDPRTVPTHPAFDGPADAFAKEALLFGSPSTIRDYVVRYAQHSDANYFVGSFQWGDLTHTESSKSLRLFADEVMPAVETVEMVG